MNGQGEALSQTVSDETGLPRREPEGAGRDLLAQALARENMQRAWKRVKANKGAAGVDGLDIARTGELPQTRVAGHQATPVGRHVQAAACAARGHPEAGR